MEYTPYNKRRSTDKGHKKPKDPEIPILHLKNIEFCQGCGEMLEDRCLVTAAIHGERIVGFYNIKHRDLKGNKDPKVREELRGAYFREFRIAYDSLRSTDKYPGQKKKK